MNGDVTDAIFKNVTYLRRLYNVTNDDWAYIRAVINFSASSDTGPTASTYCANFAHVSDTYRDHYHGYLSIVICVFGTIANLANVAVLTRRDLAGASINRILTALAICDMFVMVEYIPFAYYHNVMLPVHRDFSHAGAVFVLLHMNYSNVLHTVSICFTIALAVWRYIAIRYPHKNSVLNSTTNCKLVIITCFALPLVLCVPYYITFSIVAYPTRENNEPITLYKVDLSRLARAHHDRLYFISFLLYSVIFKLLPCAILTVISVYLIKALCNAKRRKELLRMDYNLRPEPRSMCKSERRANRTTKLLVAVLLLFLITELPQGVLGLLSVTLGREFFVGCYNKFGELMDMLALLNGSINFILYCCMSKQFRGTFGSMFRPRLRWRDAAKSAQPLGGNSVQNTFV